LGGNDRISSIDIGGNDRISSIVIGGNNRISSIVIGGNNRISSIDTRVNDRISSNNITLSLFVLNVFRYLTSIGSGKKDVYLFFIDILQKKVKRSFLN